MSTRPTDPRGASRRKPSPFGEETGLDIGNDAPATTRRAHGYHPPSTIQQISAIVRQVQATGKCAICGAPARGAGVTCKQPACISKWVLGR